MAQKNGTVRIYDIVSQRPFMSFGTLTSPLKCVDWSTANPIRVGGVVSNEWEIWDISQYRYERGVCCQCLLPASQVAFFSLRANKFA